MAKWQEYSEKFQVVTPREQYLIIATGLIAIIFISFSLFIDDAWQSVEGLSKQIKQTTASNQNTLRSVDMLEQALLEDPNDNLKKEISQYQNKLSKVDEQLLKLTSDLIDPVQMRYALAKLLKLQKGIKIMSFQVLEAKPLELTPMSSEVGKVQDKNNVTSTSEAADEAQANSLHLYRHGIKITLQGQYFQLRDYLLQLESLSWKFFWQEFDYQLKEYPNSELEIEIYSLSTTREFIGV
jgi:MSHA biogenesis protein MshJ